jgi:hypothetical protein
MGRAAVISVRRAAPALLPLLLAACVPAPSAETPVAPAADSGAAACGKAGGTMKPVGKLRSLQCVIAYSDAGKACSSGSQCAGDCRADPGADAVPGRKVAGFCQATSDRFGCSTRVEGGVAQATICID